MSSTANFTTFWKVDWSEFGDLSAKSISKDFTTTHDNVSFHWRATLGRLNSSPEGWFGFSLNYVDGVLPYLEGVLPFLKDAPFLTSIKKGNGNYQVVIDSEKDETTGSDWDMTDWVWPDWEQLSAIDFRNKYGLTTLDSISYKITIKIPLSAFSYSPTYQVPNIPSCISEMYTFLEDEQKSEYSDVRLVSREGKMFYCHRIVLRRQSEGLAGIFRHPTTEEEKAGVFRFPKLSTEVLQVALECMYKGDVQLKKLSTAILLEVHDFAEQYQLKSLKEICSVCLWERVAEKPDDADHLLRFADLYGLKHLKDRAMNVLLENCEKFEVHGADFWKIEGEMDEQGEKLREEFNLFVHRRLTATIEI